MKIRSLISLSMAAFMITACSNEEELAFTATKGMLKATVESNNPTTRVGFDAEGVFYWSTGDALGVTTSTSKDRFNKFTLSEGSGQASGTFSGTYVGTIEGYAVYPYNESHSMSGTTLAYNFPASYTYSKVDTDYFTEIKGTGNSFNPAMWGSISNGSVSLKHLGGVFCIKIEKMPVTSGTLTFTSDKAIAGSFNVDLNDADPIITSTNGNSENNTVSISFEGATKEQSGVFYVPVPTGVHSVSIKMVDSNQKEQINCVAGTFTINRRKAQKLIVKSGSISGSEQQSVGTLSEAQSSLQSNDNVSVANEVSGQSNTVSIPSNTQGASKGLSLEKVASGASLEVLDGSSSSGTQGNSVDNFILSIPYNKTTGFEPLDVNIKMPNTTVTLAGNAGAATYGNVTTETADNTLIISSGVEVQKVIVEKGNIRVNKGAKLIAIEKSPNNKAATVTVYKEDGAEIPSSLDEKFVVVDAAVADMQKVFAEGGTYTLPQNMNIVGVKMRVPKGKEVTLDLNGKTLEAANDGLIRVEGSFILQDNAGNGVIKATKDFAGPYTTGIIYVDGEDAKMTMKSGFISAVRPDPVNHGQFGISVVNGGDVTIEGGRIEAGWYAVVGYGGCQKQNSIINITGGELVSTADYAVYLPQAGTTTISGGTIKGACGAIGMRSGTLNINGQAKLIGEGTGNTGDWADGTGAMGNAVINIGNGKANTYGNCIVNITGGTFIAGGESVGIAKREDGAKHNIAVSVTGGTFSDLSAIGFIAENADVNIELNKDIEIQKAVTLTKARAVTTINLNGHTIANNTDFNNAGDWETEGFVVTAGTLNIKGEGKLECKTDSKNDGYREVISAYGESVVNLYGGSYKNYQKTNGQQDLIYAKDNAVVNIYGGTYESGGYNARGYWVLNLKDNSAAKINVYGGSFKNFNPCNHLCETPNANFVAEGYQVTCNGKVTTEVHDLSGGDKTYVVSKIAQ